MQNIWNEIVEKLQQFVARAGFLRVVIGASGGIDSSVVACAAAIALGTRNVLLVMMPSPYSSEGSIKDTLELAHNWGFQTISLPIAGHMDRFADSMYTAKSAMYDHIHWPTQEDSFTEENIQARIRMVLLMALSNQYNCLVLNTCNKSEDYTGYATLYGDTCGAIAPIGDLYKTEVYELAEWINANPNLPSIPDAILTKAPSAELSEGQLDTDSLPPYNVLDPIIRRRVEARFSEEALITLGHDPEIVAQVLKLIDGSEYKRAQSAPVLKLDRGDR